MLIHMSIVKFYRFEGWTFEYDRNKPFGPWPCKKDFEPRKRAGKKFYDMFERFNDMPIEAQESFRL